MIQRSKKRAFIKTARKTLHFKGTRCKRIAVRLHLSYKIPLVFLGQKMFMQTLKNKAFHVSVRWLVSVG